MNDISAYTYEDRVRQHPLYAALFHRVSRCEIRSGRYASQWRTFERNLLYTVGKPYGPGSGLFSGSIQCANDVARRMIAEVFPTPWPGGDRDMIAAIYNVARAEINARQKPANI